MGSLVVNLDNKLVSLVSRVVSQDNKLANLFHREVPLAANLYAQEFNLGNPSSRVCQGNLSVSPDKFPASLFNLEIQVSSSKCSKVSSKYSKVNSQDSKGNSKCNKASSKFSKVNS